MPNYSCSGPSPPAPQAPPAQNPPPDTVIAGFVIDLQPLSPAILMDSHYALQMKAPKEVLKFFYRLAFDARHRDILHTKASLCYAAYGTVVAWVLSLHMLAPQLLHH